MYTKDKVKIIRAYLNQVFGKLLSKFMCISHLNQSSDQCTKMSKTSIEDATLI